jgi:hypothetical protein
MKNIILFVLLFSSCAAPVDANTPQVVSGRLSAQVERISPLLAWTCDGRVPARSEGVECAVEGDAVSMTGWALLYGNLGQWSAISDSIDSDGRPWRNPSRVGGNDLNSFSRDQMIGLIEGTVASGDTSVLRSVVDYIDKTGRLCPGDNRCNITGSIMELWRLALGETVTAGESQINGWATEIEAKTVPPGYQVHLIMRKIMLHAKLGKLSSSYSKAAATLKKRFPKSLFVRTVDAVANRGEFVGVAEDLAACMERWERSGTGWVGEEVERGCQTSGYGHEYVSLAKFLLQSKELTQ